MCLGKDSLGSNQDVQKEPDLLVRKNTHQNPQQLGPFSLLTQVSSSSRGLFSKDRLTKHTSTTALPHKENC